MAKILNLKEIMDGLYPEWSEDNYYEEVARQVYISERPYDADISVEQRVKLTRVVYAQGFDLARALGVCISGAAWESQDFGGTCAIFVPAYKRQKCPEHIDKCDESGDWEDYNRFDPYTNFIGCVDSYVGRYTQGHKRPPTEIICHESYKKCKQPKDKRIKFVKGSWCSPNLIVCL